MKFPAIILLSALSMAVFSCANTQPVETEEPKTPQPLPGTDRYELFETKNMWTFLKLDTSTGKIWQVQYSINENADRIEVPLNANRLMPATANDTLNYGRFTLYPTQNFYNFILLDQIDGRMWQVQWSMNADNRFIIPIL